MSRSVSAPPKRLLTRAEAAQYCGLGSSPLPVPAKRIRPGKQGLRYDLKDLDAWIDNLDGGEQDSGSMDWLAKLDDEENEGSGR